MLGYLAPERPSAPRPDVAPVAIETVRERFGLPHFVLPDSVRVYTNAEARALRAVDVGGETIRFATVHIPSDADRMVVTGILQVRDPDRSLDQRPWVVYLKFDGQAGRWDVTNVDVLDPVAPVVSSDPTDGSPIADEPEAETPSDPAPAPTEADRLRRERDEALAALAAERDRKIEAEAERRRASQREKDRAAELEERERATARARDSRATSILQLGKNHERDGRRAAAILCYREVVRDYPTTKAARDAEEALKALGGK